MRALKAQLVLRFRMPTFRSFAIARALLAVLGFLCGSLGAQNNNDKIPTGTENQAPVELKVASNLVVVRVVVHDAQGNPVEGLQKEDFKLFDRGKEQSIAQFEAEVSAPEVPIPAIAATPNSPATVATQAPVAPKRFLVLYFDDLDMSDSDVIDARDAADHYLSTNLEPDERVAIFTSSAMLSDFTVDLKQIHDALFRLHPHPKTAHHSDCPEISDYQAQEMNEHENPNTSDAWKVALDEAVNRCHLPTNSDVHSAVPTDFPAPSDAAPQTVAIVRGMARSILDASQIQARMSMQGLEQVVNVIARAPGQRSVILVSSGFLSQSNQYHLDHVIDRALRSQVVISSLDPRGLAILMREADVTNGYAPSAASGVVGPQHVIDTDREMVAGDVMAEVAEGTGGEFFRNNNDLTAGFRGMAGSQGAYILAFAPTNAKQDGKFHGLKVTLTEKHRGFAVQARRGYFATRDETVAKGPAQLDTQPQAVATTDAEAQDRERIREAAISKTDVHELPVEIRTEVSTAADHQELAVLAHLDTKTLHFQKNGERNQNTLNFVSVILDRNAKYVIGQQRQVKVDVPDGALPNLIAAGMDVKLTFQLKPGTYTIREVVTEAEEHRMTAFSKDVKIP